MIESALIIVLYVSLFILLILIIELCRNIIERYLNWRDEERLERWAHLFELAVEQFERGDNRLGWLNLSLYCNKTGIPIDELVSVDGNILILEYEDDEP